MEEDFTTADIIELMKKTKKTDPLFKPLKKIKTALESIGLQNISFAATPRVLAFHFGLGNELDKQFLKLCEPSHLVHQLQIIPGSAYCVLQFESSQYSASFMSCRQQMHNRPLFYQQCTYQNLTRTLIFLHCKDEFMKSSEVFPVPDCSSRYDPSSVPGLFIVEDVVSREEELELLERIDSGKWERLNNRRVQHHGFEFKYGRNQIDKDQQQGCIPHFFGKLLQRLSQIQMLKGYKFDQLTINDYFAGNGIPSHFDTHSPFEQIFVSVSLLSGIVMDFRKYNGEETSAYLKQRSVAVFSGEGRYAWLHGISGRKLDKVDGKVVYRSRRLSLTFRQIKFTPCLCPYYFYCDSQGYDQHTMKKNNPLLAKYLAAQTSQVLATYSSRQIEREFVEKAYNGFGFDFHNKVIEQIKGYLEKQLMKSDLLLDIGCGNGEYLKYIKEEVFYIAIQKCTVMLPVQNEFFMDCMALSFRTATFDSAIFVAVLHHLASEESRLKALREVNRVLRSAGVLYLSVFNYDSKRQIYSSPEILLEYCLPANKLGEREVAQNGHEKQLPRKEQRGQVYSRYYHLFTRQEITGLVLAADFSIAEVLETKENLIVKAVKK